jgi:hypothetical protein
VPIVPLTGEKDVIFGAAIVNDAVKKVIKKIIVKVFLILIFIRRFETRWYSHFKSKFCKIIEKLENANQKH